MGKKGEKTINVLWPSVCNPGYVFQEVHLVSYYDVKVTLIRMLFYKVLSDISGAKPVSNGYFCNYLLNIFESACIKS